MPWISTRNANRYSAHFIDEEASEVGGRMQCDPGEEVEGAGGLGYQRERSEGHEPLCDNFDTVGIDSDPYQGLDAIAKQLQVGNHGDLDDSLPDEPLESASDGALTDLRRASEKSVRSSPVFLEELDNLSVQIVDRRHDWKSPQSC